MGVARFTEVPASLEELGSGVTSRLAVWALTIASGVAEFMDSFTPSAHSNSSFGDKLDNAVSVAVNPGAAPTVLLALAVFVWLLRQAAVLVLATGLVRQSLDATDLADEPREVRRSSGFFYKTSYHARTVLPRLYSATRAASGCRLRRNAQSQMSGDETSQTFKRQRTAQRPSPPPSTKRLKRSSPWSRKGTSTRRRTTKSQKR